jgi:hypothetical protein
MNIQPNAKAQAKPKLFSAYQRGHLGGSGKYWFTASIEARKELETIKAAYERLVGRRMSWGLFVRRCALETHRAMQLRLDVAGERRLLRHMAACRKKGDIQ